MPFLHTGYTKKTFQCPLTLILAIKYHPWWYNRIGITGWFRISPQQQHRLVQKKWSTALTLEPNNFQLFSDELSWNHIIIYSFIFSKLILASMQYSRVYLGWPHASRCTGHGMEPLSPLLWFPHWCACGWLQTLPIYPCACLYEDGEKQWESKRDGERETLKREKKDRS